MKPSNPPGLYHLSDHGFDLLLQPDCGGRIVALQYEGHDLLVPDRDPGKRILLGAGCFPLVPFSNRIRNGKFSFDGHSFELAPNWDGDQHVIHGEGWMRPWTVTDQTDSMLSMSMTGSGWWPWDYDCTQVISLRPGRVLLSLHLANRDRVPMPAGLGFHPYFPRHSDTRLHFSASGVLPPMSERPVSIEPLTPDTEFTLNTHLTGRRLDHCYAGWLGVSQIRQPGQSLDITIRTDHTPAAAVLYIPDDAPVFCFEPVSHINGAFEISSHADTGLRRVKPGESLTFTITIDAGRDNID